MNLLSNGRAGLGQAMSAQNSSTALANQMQAERAKLKIANDNANSASAGQMTGLAGSAAVTMGPKAYDALMTPSSLNTTNAAGSLGASGDSALSGSLNGSSMNMANTGTSAITGTAWYPIMQPVSFPDNSHTGRVPPSSYCRRKVRIKSVVLFCSIRV